MVAKIEWYQDELFPCVGFTEGFSLGFRREGVILMPEWPGGGARRWSPAVVKWEISGYFKETGQ